MTEQHRPACTQALEPTQSPGNRGDIKFICPECRQFWFRSPDDLPDEPASPPVLGRYRCGIHTDTSVNWRGKGCAYCKTRPSRRRPRGIAS